MTEPHRAVIARLSSDFAAISQYMARVSTDLTTWTGCWRRHRAAPVRRTGRSISSRSIRRRSTPSGTRRHRLTAAPTPPAAPPTPPFPPVAKPARDEGWIGKLLAVAGVAVTLIGVVLLLVLAAQAGILRPEIRVAAGAVLAAALVGAAAWLYARPGGRVGAIALAATGVAAAYMDVIAMTTIYGWVSAPIGLVIAAVIGGGGLTLARRWDSESPRAAGAGATARAGARRDRRHHAAAGGLHAGAVGRLVAGAAGQGLDLDALRPHRCKHTSIVGGAGRGLFRRRARSLAGRCVRHRGGAGHRRRAHPFAADRQPGADGPADRRGRGARAMRGAGRRQGGRRADGCRPFRGAAVDRAHRRSVERGRRHRAADLGRAFGDLGADRRAGRVRRPRRRPRPAGDGGGGGRRGSPRRRREVGRARLRRLRRGLLPELRTAEHAGRGDRAGPGEPGCRP